MLNATIIGQYFLSKNPDLTDIQIQKLVYYTYSWYMVKNNGEKLFGEKPQAWIHGPVFRTLFDSMKDYKKFSKTNEIEKIEKDITNFLFIEMIVIAENLGKKITDLYSIQNIELQ